MKRKILNGVMGVMVCVLILTAAGCGSQQQGADEDTVVATTGDTTYPVTIKDDLGYDITFDKEPEKIVSLSPANTEILFSLDASDKMVGRTSYDNYPEEASKIESIGDFNQPNIEKIISMSPDVILATDIVNDDVRKQVEATGTKVAVFSPKSVDTVEKSIINIGKIVNENDKAKEITDSMTKKYEEIKTKAEKINPQKSVFIDIGDYYSAGEGSLLGSMLNDVNAKNIAAETGVQWPQLSTEQIIAKNPDIYLSFLAQPEDIKKVAGFDQINAVKNNGIVYHDMLSKESDLIQRPGPRIVEGLELLAKDIYPEQFN